MVESTAAQFQDLTATAFAKARRVEDQLVVLSDGGRRQTPSARAVAANTWHYLLSRRLEIQAFLNLPAIDVIERDIVRDAKLTSDRDTSAVSALVRPRIKRVRWTPADQIVMAALRYRLSQSAWADGKAQIAYHAFPSRMLRAVGSER